MNPEKQYAGLSLRSDHYLKGAPAPEWMERGIPYLEREKEKEKYRTVTDEKAKPPAQR